jgi:hypothetical protein
MIEVRTPNLKSFNYKECKALYDANRTELQDGEFDRVINNTLFFAFYIKKTNELIGCIYFYNKGKRLFVNVFATRGHHLLNVECFKESLSWFKCDIYAEALHPTSRIGCIRCGFKRLKDNIFVYRR